MKKTVAALLALFLLTLCAPEPPSFRQITMEEAISLMETEENYLILDIRTQEFGGILDWPGQIVTE